MKVVRTMPHKRYPCDEAVEVFEPDFCEKFGWTIEKNYDLRFPGERVIILPDHEGAVTGDLVIGESIVPPNVVLIEHAFIDKKEEIKAARYADEEAGTVIDINGLSVTVPTDEKTQRAILGVKSSSDTDPNYTSPWKVNDDLWITADRPLILLISAAIRNHIQDCFNKEKIAVDRARQCKTLAELQAVKYGEDIEL